MTRSAQAYIYPERLRHNAQQARRHAPNTKLTACVKADGYGHGIGTVAAAISDVVDSFAVACVEEALALRDAEIDLPVLLLEGPQSEDELAIAAQQGFIPCLNEWHQLEWLESMPQGSFDHLWLKIDTGMHRLGFVPKVATEIYERVKQAGGADATIVACTHFAKADQRDNSFSQLQLDRFDSAVRGMNVSHSCANSAAIMNFPNSHRDWIRPGYMLYGGSPFSDADPASLNLQPAMELQAEVISIRQVPRGDSVGYGGRWIAPRNSRIATIAIGYGDGYPRHAPDGTPVGIGGDIASLAGRVSMDMITVDVTDIPSANVGSIATLWGENPGVDAVALACGTIGYELLAAMPPRAPRRIVGGKA